MIAYCRQHTSVVVHGAFIKRTEDVIDKHIENQNDNIVLSPYYEYPRNTSLYIGKSGCKIYTLSYDCTETYVMRTHRRGIKEPPQTKFGRV